MSGTNERKNRNVESEVRGPCGPDSPPQDCREKKWVKRVEETETGGLRPSPANETGDWSKSHGLISLEVKVQEYSVPAFPMRLELCYPCSHTFRVSSPVPWEPEDGKTLFRCFRIYSGKTNIEMRSRIRVA